MKRAALFTILCMLFAAGAYAQEANPSDAPASKEDVMRYLDAMHTRDLMSSMMSMMTRQTVAMVHQAVSKQQGLPPDAEARIDKMMQDMTKNFPVDDMLQAMIPVYQKHFTKGDIDALVAFYSSPIGQKLIAELPAITQESMQASMGIAQKMAAKMQQQIQDDINQMRQENKQAPQ